MNAGASANANDLAIDGELTIYRAAELRQWLDDCLRNLPPGAAVRLSLAGVTEIDTAGAQLLLAAKRLAKGRDCQLHCVDHSPAVLSLLGLFDLAAQLGDALPGSAKVLAEEATA